MVVKRFAFIVLSLLVHGATCDIELDLGDDSYTGVWTARSGNGSIKVPAAVPGGIYSDLLHAGVLDQSLYYRFNDITYRWVSEQDWTFTRHFTVSQDILDYSSIQLICDGIDTVSNVTVNGQLIGSTINQFVRYNFSVKDVLKLGLNSIEVSVRSPSAYATERYQHQAKDYIVPPKCPPPEQHGVCHANHIRKMQASFSWDWGPAFPNMGVWKPIKLRAFDYVTLLDVMVETEPESEDNLYGPWLVRPRLKMHVAQRTEIVYNITVQGMPGLTGGGIDVDSNTTEATLYPVITPQLFKDDLWWPNGRLGTPKLHNVTICLKLVIGISEEDLLCRNVTFGFRRVRLIQEPVDANNASKGLTFYFSVNDIPVFAKGSNWIPGDVLTERVTKSYLRQLLTSARDANMNMLRVWGGGIYELDDFYDLADELGLMVWQDMMFACAMYPTDEAFLASVRQEVNTQLWRLQHHPSIVVWAGNNENEAALRGNWYGTNADFDRYKKDYVSLYVDTVRDEVTKVFGHLGNIHFFVTSSPSNGDESDAEGYVAQNPYSTLYGDTHVYDYMRDMWNEKIFPRARFASEYGLQSWPSILALETVSEPEDLVNNSEFVQHRQHHPTGNAELILEIGQHFKLPADINSPGGFEDFVYLSQINQALAIRSETEFYRRGMTEISSNGEGRTMGAMFWQLNDIWQAPTWASIEYGGRWKALQYAARSFFSSLMASPFVTGQGDDQKVTVYAISDLTKSRPGGLRVEVFSWDKFAPPSTRIIPNLTFGANSAVNIWSAPLSEVTPDPATQLARFTLLDENNYTLSEPSELFSVSFEKIRLSVANVRVTNVTAPHLEDNRLTTNTLNVQVIADAPAPFVWLETSLPGRFSDNFFTILDAGGAWVTFESEEPTDPVTLKNSITVKSLQDAYQ